MWSEKASNWALGDVAGSVLATWWIYRFKRLMQGDPASRADPCSINCEHAPYWTCGRCTLQNVLPVPEFFFFWSQLWRERAAMSGGVMRWSVSSGRSLNSNSASPFNIYDWYCWIWLEWSGPCWPNLSVSLCSYVALQLLLPPPPPSLCSDIRCPLSVSEQVGGWNPSGRTHQECRMCLPFYCLLTYHRLGTPSDILYLLPPPLLWASIIDKDKVDGKELYPDVGGHLQPQGCVNLPCAPQRCRWWYACLHNRQSITELWKVKTGLEVWNYFE